MEKIKIAGIIGITKGLYRGYIGIIGRFYIYICWVHIGRMETKMETTIIIMCYIGTTVRIHSCIPR